MEVSVFKDKFSELFSLIKEGNDFVGSSGNIEIRLTPYLDNQKMLSSASLIFPNLKPENEDTSLGVISSILFIVLTTEKKTRVDNWINEAISKFREDKVYKETLNGVILRLSSVDHLFYLLARFDSHIREVSK